jgi:hypothetical protein
VRTNCFQEAKDPEKLATLTPKALSSTCSEPEEAISTNNDGDEKGENFDHSSSIGYFSSDIT